MKLAIATTAIALIVSTAASAMVPASISAHPDFGGETLTKGANITLSVADYGLDGRSAAQVGSDVVTLSSF